MPKYTDIKKVLVLGSGPIVIGQAAEFDYAGTQACRALKEEGLEVVLVNSNPATIMTDKDIADHVYIEPMNIPSITQVIEKERPDALLPNMGGQTGLNMACLLYTSMYRMIVRISPVNKRSPRGIDVRALWGGPRDMDGSFFQSFPAGWKISCKLPKSSPENSAEKRKDTSCQPDDFSIK